MYFRYIVHYTITHIFQKDKIWTEGISFDISTRNMRVELVFNWLVLFKVSVSKVYGNTKRNTDMLENELDDDFFDEIDRAQEVLEVPVMEYEDDNKPSKFWWWCRQIVIVDSSVNE